MMHPDRPKARLRPHYKTAAAAMVLTTLCSAANAQKPPGFDELRPTPPSATNAPASLQAQRSMVAVAAGSCRIGRDSAADQSPLHIVQLQAIRIDRTEVTSQAFAEFLSALGLDVRGTSSIVVLDARHGPPAALQLVKEDGEGSGRYPIFALDDDQVRIVLRAGRFIAAPGYETHPVAETTWAGARVYCRWRGARLPTEAECQAAARGNDQFPWGDEAPSAAHAFVSGRAGITAPVGTRPADASPAGALDMSGSMAEWTSSLKRPFPYRTDDGRESPTAAGERVTRGGDYIYDRSPQKLPVSHRNGFSNAPERGHRHIGFRCAAS